MEKNKFDEEKIAKLQQEVPIYTIEVDTSKQSYQIDPKNGQITKATGISLPYNEQYDVDHFILTYFGEGYTLQAKEDSESNIFVDWELKYVFSAPTTFNDISKVVEIYTNANKIVEFQHFGVAKGFSLTNADESVGQIIISLFSLLFLFVLFIIVTVQLIKRLIKKQIEGFIGPFLLSLIAGFGWFFLTSSMGATISGFGAFEPGVMTYLTFATLLIRWKKTSESTENRLLNSKNSIFQGLLLTIVGLALTNLFFYIASFFGSWISPVLNHGLLINVNPWILPIFTLFVGISAAITEEAIFRQYMIPFFDRFSVIISVILTSFLWGILHLGYDVYPWYLRVIEFMIIGGPFYYIVYKKFGFKTAIFCHYFNNSFITILFLWRVDLMVAIVALFLSLSPLLVLLLKTKSHEATVDQYQVL
ncbi:CPBP family intramembrane metalloprotease [Bacillus sp. Bva_UNVM-123]|uniref:CPBP family intramembrane glutamic endopeptidase n=1 Tax=Bacillus sp. Bva_UNVM-123 TaxID=2829798 RepID=UPI00391F254C